MLSGTKNVGIRLSGNSSIGAVVTSPVSRPNVPGALSTPIVTATTRSTIPRTHHPMTICLAVLVPEAVLQVIHTVKGESCKVQVAS
jgi:hypothetical protein